MEFIGLTTPEGALIIRKDRVIAVIETKHEGIGCKIWFGEGEDAYFSVLESFKEVADLV